MNTNQNDQRTQQITELGIFTLHICVCVYIKPFNLFTLMNTHTHTHTQGTSNYQYLYIYTIALKALIIHVKEH